MADGYSGQKHLAAMRVAVTLSHVAEGRYQRVSVMLQQFIRHSKGYRASSPSPGGSST